jgi:uncharacterized protein YggE
MRYLIFISAFLVSSLAAQAQQPNTVSTTVSTTQPVAASTAVITVQFYDAGLNSTLDTALAVVGSTGANAANLTASSVYLNQGFLITEYDFTIEVPSGEFTATRDKLVAVQRTLATSNTQGLDWTNAYTISDDDTAKALESALPGLIDKGRAQASVLAAAMGAKLGKLSAISTPDPVKTGLSATLTAKVTFLIE